MLFNLTANNTHIYYYLDIRGYPQRMRLQRRLYRNYTVCFLLFRIPCGLTLHIQYTLLEMEFKEFKPRIKSAKIRQNPV